MQHARFKPHAEERTRNPVQRPDFICLVAEFYLVDRGLRHRLPGFSSLGRLDVLP